MRKALLGTGLVLLMTAGMAQAEPLGDCQLRLDGPQRAAPGEFLYRPPRLLAPGPGYVDEEYRLSCGDAFHTIVNIRRPQWSGALGERSVIVEPTHPGNIWPVLGTAMQYIESAGHVAVAVSSSQLVVERIVKPANPERYADLHIPDGAEVESEILARLGRHIQEQGLPGTSPRSVVLAGYSNTAGRVRTYIEQRHDSARMPDGSAIYDGYYPGQTAVGTLPGPIPELDVPVIEIQGERELIATFNRNPDGLAYRREDSEMYRLYEVPGMSHIDTSHVGRYPFPPEYCGIEDPAEIPLGLLWGNTLDRLIRWIELGEVPPRAERIGLENDGQSIARDRYGNAEGGYPLVHIEVPLKQYRTVSENEPDYPDARCDMIGPQFYLSHEVLEQRYGAPVYYLNEFDRRLTELVEGGWYLPGFVDELRQRARGWAAQAFPAEVDE